MRPQFLQKEIEGTLSANALCFYLLTSMTATHPKNLLLNKEKKSSIKKDKVLVKSLLLTFSLLFFPYNA
jgi:hypothetical protein